MPKTTETVQEAISGREELANPDDPLYALVQFYRAFNSRDLELMKRNWDDSAQASMDNPLGGIMRGWNEVGSVYERIFSGKARVQVEFYDYTVHRFGDVCYFVGRERGDFTKGGKSLRVAIRTTRVFHRTERGEWRQIHHHGSMDDPKLLAEYQEAVRG